MVENLVGSIAGALFVWGNLCIYILDNGVKVKMFKCDCCALCCMNLKMSEIYSDLDRGDGICKYLDVTSKLCSIYKNRPDKCNVDKLYEKLYKNVIAIEEYYELNYEVCKKLKEKGE